MPFDADSGNHDIERCYIGRCQLSIRSYWLNPTHRCSPAAARVLPPRFPRPVSSPPPLSSPFPPPGFAPWAALPSLLAAGSLLVALFGMYWDISLHIDDGRDEGRSPTRPTT